MDSGQVRSDSRLLSRLWAAAYVSSISLLQGRYCTPLDQTVDLLQDPLDLEVRALMSRPVISLLPTAAQACSFSCYLVILFVYIVRP